MWVRTTRVWCSRAEVRVASKRARCFLRDRECPSLDLVCFLTLRHHTSPTFGFTFERATLNAQEGHRNCKMSLAMRRVLTALAVVVASVALVLLVEVERAAAKAVVRGDEVVLASKRHTTTGANSPVQLANHYAASSSSSSSHTMELPDLINATILQLQHGLKNGHFSSQDLILAYLKRIDEVNDELHAVIETSPSHKLLAEAKKLDEERKGGCRGHLHGIPMLVKVRYKRWSGQ